MSRLATFLAFAAIGCVGYIGLTHSQSDTEIACNSDNAMTLVTRIVKENSELRYFFNPAAVKASGRPEADLAIIGTQTLDTSTSIVSRCKAGIKTSVAFLITQGSGDTIPIFYTVQRTDDNQIAVNVQIRRF